MHIDLASLLKNAALIAIGVLAVGFLLWFLIALTMEKNRAHVRCRMEFQIDPAAEAIDRQSIREVAAPHSWPKDLNSAQPVFRPSHILVTHRALRSIVQTAEDKLPMTGRLDLI